MGSNTCQGQGQGYSYEPLRAPLQLTELPSLVELLRSSFALVGGGNQQENGGDPPSKRPKLVLVKTPDPVTTPDLIKDIKEEPVEEGEVRAPIIPAILARPKLSVLKTPAFASPTTPAVAVIQDIKEEPEAPSFFTEIIGIPIKEFRNDPCILFAIRRLLNVLKTVVIRRFSSQLSFGLEEIKEEVEVLEQEMINLKKCFEEVQQLSKYTWEQLNIGHWKTVPRFWRKLYTCLQIIKVAFMVLKAHPTLEIIKECDLGLLMGEPISSNVLSKIAEELSSKIIEDVCDAPTLSTIKTELEAEEPGPETAPAKGSLQEPSKSLFRTILKNKSDSESRLNMTHQPCLQEFLSAYMNSSCPGLLLNTIDHWPALKKWNVDYINKHFGFRTVPVEVGQRYTSEDWTQKIMTISEFIKTYMKSPPTSSGPGPSNDIGYIAQYTLFDQLPELKKDIRIPDYCTLGSEPIENTEINAWFGPAHTISPCHFDQKHNILVQIFGYKAIRLYPPGESPYLQPYPNTSLLFNTSQLDVEEDDLFEKYPDMKEVQHYDTILGPGMALYIPPKWWHYVKSLSPSFSVSFWFQ